MNRGYTYTECIDDSGAGQALVAYLTARYRHASHDEWLAHIGAGRVSLDGIVAHADIVLVAEQRLEYRRPSWDEPEAPLDCPVLYDEGGVLVVYKPAGLPTMASGLFLEHTLLRQVALTDPEAAPLHRLDRWTSGAVICGRTQAVRAAITKQFVQKAVQKRYRTLASGVIDADFDVNIPIGPVPYAPMGTVHAASAAGRPASTRVTVIERRADSTLCDVAIFTGRPHQIRIHLAAAGHPLVGDPVYGLGGLPLPGCLAVPGDPGFSLHAASIGFRHPETGEHVVVEAPLPPWAQRTVGET